MDDKTNALLQQILVQQKEQTELLRKHLGRFRFSLRAIFLTTTFTCVALVYLGMLANKPQPIFKAPVRTTAKQPVSFPNNLPMAVDGNRDIPDRTGE